MLSLTVVLGLPLFALWVRRFLEKEEKQLTNQQKDLYSLQGKKNSN